jgi:hypothetical protein
MYTKRGLHRQQKRPTYTDLPVPRRTSNSRYRIEPAGWSTGVLPFCTYVTSSYTYVTSSHTCGQQECFLLCALPGVKRGLSYGKRGLSYGKRGLSYGKRGLLTYKALHTCPRSTTSLSLASARKLTTLIVSVPSIRLKPTSGAEKPGSVHVIPFSGQIRRRY